jgi:hypothetical protein
VLPGSRPVSFRRLAFDTTMPTACKHLVCASVFGRVADPIRQGQ